MINPKQLQIGNIIYCKTNSMSVVVQCPHPAKIVVDVKHPDGGGCDFVDGDLEEFDPIPLTPEWLNKCGFSFTVSETVSYFIPIGDKLRIEFDEYLICGLALEMWDRRVRIPIIAEIKYLHQLQNLYQSHTGNELEIKL